MRDYAEVKARGTIDADVAGRALAMLEVDPQGLDLMDRKLLEAIIHKFDGGPVAWTAWRRLSAKSATPSRT